MSTQVESIRYSTTLVATICGECGIPFGLPKSFHDARYKDGQLFYCPNGHHINWTETEAIRLQAKLDQVQADRDWWSRVATERRHSIEAEKKRHAATKGQLTKTRKRAVAGLCPCCSRSFVDVRRHMANRHPAEAVRGLGDGSS